MVTRQFKNKTLQVHFILQRIPCWKPHGRNSRTIEWQNIKRWKSTVWHEWKIFKQSKISWQCKGIVLKNICINLYFHSIVIFLYLWLLSLIRICLLMKNIQAKGLIYISLSKTMWSITEWNYSLTINIGQEKRNSHMAPFLSPTGISNLYSYMYYNIDFEIPISYNLTSSFKFTGKFSHTSLKGIAARISQISKDFVIWYRIKTWNSFSKGLKLTLSKVVYLAHRSR